MAWETRKNGNYLYRKVKKRGKVRSVYIGRGDVAEIEIHRQAERKAELEAQKQERAEAELIDQKIDEFSQLNETLVDALFLINGFHQHKRQWRMKRK